ALLAVSRLVMDVSVRAADDLGSLSPVQLRALTLLHALGETNLAHLATEMGVTVSTASRLVDRLAAAGRVVRRPSPANGRQLSLTLSDAGRALLRDYDDRRVSALRRHLDAVPTERREAVVNALREFAG
ncbi:MAG: MarR family winged helix-turn-helix transcriptional regulator, partial [Blastococcus sp.]